MKPTIKFSKLPRRVVLPIALVLTVATSALVASCGSSGGVFSGLARIVGQALAPLEGAIGDTPIPLAGAVVSVRDFLDDQAAARVMDVGVTDENGNYDVQVEAQAIAAVIINGEVDGNPVRISGLVLPNSLASAKDLNGITDVACEAGISSIVDGSTSTEEFRDGTRVQNLEQAAAQFLAQNEVNFFDPASVSNAARSVRELTNNGATSAGAPAPEPTGVPAETSTCSQGETTCADGFPICTELVCNGTVDCADQSDEDPALCVESRSCCQETAGCPDETADECGADCCCCALGLVCDQNNFQNGCIAGRSTGVGAESSLSKLILKGEF